MWLGAFDAWNKQKIKAYTESRIAAKNNNWKISPAIEDFFIRRIQNAEPNFERYIWGSLYSAFAVMCSHRRWSAISSVLAISIFLGMCYLPRGVGNILFVIPGIMIIHAYLPILSPMLIAGGRKERFWASFATIAADAILCVLVTSGFALLVRLFVPIMPPLTISDRIIPFTPLDIRLFFIPLFIVPLMMTIRLLLHKTPLLMSFIAIIVFSAVWSSITVFFTASCKNMVLPYVNPLSIMCLIIIAWSIFVMVLRHICLKRNLV